MTERRERNPHQSICEGLGFESGVDRRFGEAKDFYWLLTLLIVFGAGVHPALPFGGR